MRGRCLLLDDKPANKAEAVRLELTSGCAPPPVFKTGSSSGRMTSVSKVPGVGIEPTPSWFRARRHYQQQLPRNAMFNHQVPVNRERVAGVWPIRGEGLKPSQAASKADGLPLADPRSRVPCGNRTRLSSLEDSDLNRSAKGTRGKLRRRDLNPHEPG